MGSSKTDLTKTAFGLKNGKMHAAGGVASGLACECICVGCGATLVAKKGAKNRWHFAHYNVEIGESCAESAIHAAAKQVLLEHNYLSLPGMRVVVFGESLSRQAFEEATVLLEERIVRFERSCPEVWIENIRPDVVGYRGDRKLLVEMYFRHRVDNDKRKKIAKLGLPTIEIDLSDLEASTGFESITQRVLFDTEHKNWLFLPNEEQERQVLSTRLAARIERADSQHLAKQAADQERHAVRRRKLESDRKRREDATQRYRQMPHQEKEHDLRERLGITSGWPYYLRKESDGASAIKEPAMIWQAALFSRFIFQRANDNFELKQTSVLQWISERFETESGQLLSMQAEVRRYLGYLAACGFLKKLPYHFYGAQGYTVVHGELAPPGRHGNPLKESSKSRPDPAKAVRSASPPVLTERWIWRASWPSWSDTNDEITAFLAESSHGNCLRAMLHGLSPISRPDDPSGCAEFLKEWGVPKDDVMSLLEKVGFVLKVRARLRAG